MATRGRPTTRVVLDDDHRRELRRIRRSKRSLGQLAQRARIVLACAEGLPDRQVAARLGVNPKMVAKWRKRFLEGGVAELDDKPRTGRPRRITDADVRAIVSKTLSPPPAASKHWTATAMAAATGWHETTIRRVWRQCGIRPDRLLCDGFSADLWQYGTWSLTGAFRHFGQKAVAISVDAQWSNEVSPFVWRREGPRRRGPAQSAPASRRSRRVDDCRGNSGAFGKFLDAVIPSPHEGRVLFLLVNSSRLQKLALMKQWRLGQDVMCVSRADGADAWHQAARRLAGMMDARAEVCGFHGDGGQLSALLVGPERGYTVFAHRHERHHEVVNCSCTFWRQIRSEEQQQLAKSRMRPLRPRRRCRRHRRSHFADCWDCCYGVYQDLCRVVIDDWRHDVGHGKVVAITLTYRASSDLTPEEWLRRAHLDLNRLRSRWRTKWGSLPYHLLAWEFTAQGTPHLHLVVPWESNEHLRALRAWLRGCWASITGEGRHPGAGNPYAVHIRVRDVNTAVRYALKNLAVPRKYWPVPLGTPQFRSWERQRRRGRVPPSKGIYSPVLPEALPSGSSEETGPL